MMDIFIQKTSKGTTLMKKTLFSVLSLLIATIILMGAFAACTPSPEETTKATEATTQQ